MEPVRFEDICWLMLCEGNSGKEQRYVYNTYSGKAEEIDALCASLDITRQEFSPWGYGCIPIPPVDEAAAVREYLALQHRKDFDRFLKYAPKDDSFLAEFRWRFETSPYLYRCSGFIEEKAKETFIAWCKENGLPYLK